YRNVLVDLVDDLEGVRRVGRTWFRTSDDYGSTWGTRTQLRTDTAPGVTASGPGSTASGLWGLLHHASGHDDADKNFNHPGFTVTAL
ncbi:MAG: hypothetical protein ABEN55_15455, partial [Bradymonadaceae bacterium]